MARWLVLIGILASLGWTAFGAAADAVPDKKGIAFFEKRIRPVLVESCYECHSTKEGAKIKGGLALDSRNGLLQGGETGPAIVPGSPDDSLLIEAIRHDGLEMPPQKKLPDTVIADFVAWVKMGAPDPREGGKVPAAKKEIDIEAGRQFWAFQPPKPVAAPNVKDEQWPKSDVDRFVLAALETNKLKPVADADRRTWIRRVTLDLVGMIPTAAEVDAFVNDKSPQAAESVVDRLLASQQFGERWGRHWLDVARFAESNGNTDNVSYPHAWRYRDYVINAFNSDKPFDQFIREQLAGDLLPAENSKQRDELLVATGFLALGSKPRAQNNPDFQMDVVAEQIEVATTGFMALTVACARCHDHKFDPIPTHEYYAMAGLFTSTATLYSAGGGQGNGRQQNTGFHELTGDPKMAEVRQKYTTELAELREQRQKLTAELKRMGAVEKEKPANKAKQTPKKPAKNQPPVKPEDMPPVEVKVPKNASPEEADKIKQLSEDLRHCLDEINELQANAPPTGELAMGVRDAKKPDDCQICIRGDSKNRGASVPRGVVSVATVGELPKIGSNESGRLQLADWIASPNNPLTARVAVNRVWHHLFGRGLVASVDNFGELGEKPSHPELLDQLALQFVREGWSLKKLVRSLVLTRTYGLASTHVAKNYEADPDNVFLWRHTPHRMDSDQIRDAILAASGQLDLDAMTSSLVAKSAEEVVQQGRLNPATFSDASIRHRSIYLPIVRNAMPEALELFDAPDPSLVIGARDVTTVPSQSLYLMNSQFLVQQSRHFAERLLAVGDLGDSARVAMAFRIALNREPTAKESAESTDFVKRSEASIEKVEKDKEQLRVRAWAAFCQALLASAEFRFVE
jgi:cytochrome c553